MKRKILPGAMKKRFTMLAIILIITITGSAQFVVTNTNDLGPCSLRQDILDDNATPHVNATTPPQALTSRYKILKPECSSEATRLTTYSYA